MDTGSDGALRFGAFELDERARELRTGTTRIRLQDQPFEILRLLLQRTRTDGASLGEMARRIVSDAGSPSGDAAS